MLSWTFKDCRPSAALSRHHCTIGTPRDPIDTGTALPITDCLEATESIIGKFDETRVIVLSVDLNSNPPPQRSIRPVSASWCQTGACFPICQG